MSRRGLGRALNSPGGTRTASVNVVRSGRFMRMDVRMFVVVNG